MLLISSLAHVLESKLEQNPRKLFELMVFGEDDLFLNIY